MQSKKSDLAGPGISTYDEVKKILPDNYKALQPPLKRMEALYMVKEYIENGLSEELNLQMVQVPLIVRKDSGVNDYLDRDGSRTPVDFPAGLGLNRRIESLITPDECENKVNTRYITNIDLIARSPIKTLM